MAVDNMLVSNFVDLTTKYPGERQKNWSALALTTAKRNNIFADMEGPELSNKPVVRKDDFKKMKGDKIVFTTLARLGAPARLGDQALTGQEEKPKIGTFELQIDIRRHAIGTNEKHDMLTAISLEMYEAALLGEHCGWTQENDLMMTFRSVGLRNGYNLTRPNNKGSREALRSADVVQPGTIETAAELGRTRMMKVANVAKAKAGYEIPRYMFISPHPALTAFRQTSQYLQAVNFAAERGKNNYQFTGEFADWDGHIIYPHYTEDDDSNGPVGSSFAPKALLGIAIAPGTAAVTITGGGNAEAAEITQPAPLYFQFFSNYDWQFVQGQQPNPDATNRYAMIYNVIPSTVNGTDAGKWGFYRFQTNNGNTLATAAYTANDPNALAGAGGPSGGRLSATANTGGGDTRHTIVGNVTWNGAVNTDSHGEGAVILECNSYAVPIAFSLLIGGESIMRGYGKNPIKQIKQNQDYEFDKGLGYKTCYGQTPYIDTNKQPRRFVLVEHAISYAGMNLPNIAG